MYHQELTEDQLKQIKFHLIGTITAENKKEVNKQLRQLDKEIKKVKGSNEEKN